MALLNISANFSVIISVLERIAHALERLAGPEYIIPEPGVIKKRGPEAIVNYGDQERQWTRENFQNLIHAEGLAPDREQSLLNLAMKRYDYESKHQDPNDAETM